MIEGLSILEAGTVANPLTGSKFALPPGFPANMTSRWEEEGAGVIEAQQKEILVDANVAADGWQVYKVVNREKTEAIIEQKYLEILTGLTEEEKKKKLPDRPKLPPVMEPFTRVIGKRKFVLMMRPRALQGACNKIYAQTSRERIRREQAEAASAENPEDVGGMLSHSVLKKYSKLFEEEEEGSVYMAGQSTGAKPTRLHEASEVELQ
jgi:hypothetical protein